MRERWAVTGVEVTLDPSVRALGEDALDAIRLAFGTWLENEAGVPKISFVIGREPGSAGRDGINRVLATRDVLSGHEGDVAYTTTWADGVTGDILEADLTFNLANLFGATPDASPTCMGVGRYDLRAVATHEAGHFFGLAEDTEDATATMWVTTRPCDPHKRALSTGDLTAIGSLYPMSTEPVVARCSVESVGAEGGEGWPWAVLAVMIVARSRTRHGRRKEPGR